MESKIDKLQQNELVGKSQSISQEKANKSRLESRINLLNNKIDQLEDDQKKMKEDISKIKEKTDDFNVYDLFKGNTGDTNIDAAKGLIMNLENKIYKKLGLYDLKFIISPLAASILVSPVFPLNKSYTLKSSVFYFILEISSFIFFWSSSN